jgi:hypothetical protein
MAKPKVNASDRIGERQVELKRRDERIAELRDEVDELRDLVRRMEEHAQDFINCMEAWKDTFGMIETDRGGWTWEPFWEERKQLVDRYNDLARRWNKCLPAINGRQQPVGRPLGASQAQCEAVRKLRGAGTSLRGIADEANLSLATVRTIVGKTDGTDRTTKHHRIALDRGTALSWKRRKRTGDALPRQAQHVVETGQALIKEAKGHGRTR